MALLYDCDKRILDKHKELCLELNLKKVTADKSMETYREIRNNYTLDGDQVHWLCCALYVACRNSMTKCVSNSNSENTFVEGNCVPLTRLLRICNISLNDFFKKMKKWSEMASMPAEFLNKINRLERSFAVSTVIYQKYGPIFHDLFLCPTNDERVGKGKKVKQTPCTANKVFEFCWCLFVCAKGEYPKQSVDLVTSYHMLLCCADLVFANAIVDKRKDLINPKFRGIPSKWYTGEEIEEPICVMQELCDDHEGTSIDAMATKHYTWNIVIKKFFEKKILIGDDKTYMDILSTKNFEQNLKSLNNLYDTYTLSCGEFDERIFLNHKQFGANNLGGSSMKDNEKDYQMEVNKALLKDTPLTRRDYLPGKNFLTPVATATQSVTKLRSNLNGYDGKPQASLRELFIQCGENPETKIKGWLNCMSIKFCEQFLTNGQERFHLAEALYYRLLENIVRAELKQRPNSSLKTLLNLEIFNTTLIVCCVEIIISAYNSQKKFPWVLKCFQLDAFHFYKIIEMVVLYHHDHLTRDIIKHLNSIEEQALESLAWVSGSHLWDKIKQLQGPLPSWQDVEIPKQRDDDDLSGVAPHNPDFKKSDETDKNSILLSPVSSATERFHQSPSKAVAKIQLFKSPTQTNNNININNNNNNNTEPSSFSPKPEQTTDIDANSNQMDQSTINSENNLVKKPNNRAGSLGLFFRKFYKLAYIRMKELCRELGFDEDLIKKIWTIFEYSIIERTDLMRDRHLDQIIMCAIYVFNRVTKLEKTFADIMKFYRNQPQCESHVYRSVLISETDINRTENNSGTEAPIPQIPPQPSDLAGTSTYHENENRGDLIKFYNTVYVQKMQLFAMKFSNQTQSDDITLSPLPRGRCSLLSPKKVSANHSIFIHPLERKDLPQSPGSHIHEYIFNSSPAKELIIINDFIKNGRGNNNNGIKRNLPFDTDDMLASSSSSSISSSNPIIPPNKIIKITPQNNVSFMTRKVQSLMEDRQDNNNEKDQH